MIHHDVITDTDQRYSRRDFGKLAAAAGVAAASMTSVVGHALQPPLNIMPAIAPPVLATFRKQLGVLSAHPDRFAWSDNYDSALADVRAFMKGLKTTDAQGATVAAYQEVENAFEVNDGSGVTANGQAKRLTVGSRNVMFSLADGDPAAPGDVILVCAHLDSVMGCPGANDNGSGAAGVLTLAESFKDFKPKEEGKGKTTLRFALFSAEESGLLGSAAFARYLRDHSPSANIRYHVINLDMIAGRKLTDRRPDFRIEYADFPNSRPMADALGKTLEGEPYKFDVVTDSILDKPTPKDMREGQAPSDHRSFVRHGFRAVSLSQDQPYFPIHTSEDKYEDENNPYEIDTDRAVRAIAGVQAYLKDRLLKGGT